jgi:lysophospholipase L1-like esterase
MNKTPKPIGRFGGLILAALLATAASIQAQTYRILTLGDSITATIQDNYNSSYQKSLADELTAAGYSYSFVGPNGTAPNKHGGFSGQGINGVRDHLVSDLNTAFGTSAPPTGTINVVFVMLGINNMNHGLGIVGPGAVNFPPNNGSGTAQAIAPQFANPSGGSYLRGLGLSWGSSPTYDVWVQDQATQLINTIVNHASQPRVIVGSVLPVGLGNPSYQANTNNCVERIKELNQMYVNIVNAQAATGKNIRYVDNFSAANRAYGAGTDFGTSTRQTADWVHPDNNSPILDTVGINFFSALVVSNGTTMPSITSALAASATQNSTFSYTITATNNPTGYNATGLPAGLSVNTSTGVISGTPSATGSSNVSISATNGGGTDTKTLVLTVNAPAAGANNGTGLRARYYNGNIGLTGAPALTRTDSTVNFDWGSGSPGAGIGSDNFSVRWDGRIEAPVTGAYTFSTESDDGVRLWVNGVLVINQWINQAPTVVTSSTTLNFSAGTLYRVVLEYYDSGGGAVARLRWAYPGQATQVIPQGRLYAATSTILSVTNSSFESNTGQTPTDWSTWANTTANEACDFVETANPRIGANNLRHASSTGAYQVNTYRTITGLTNGTYLVRAWTRSSGGQAAVGFHISNHGSPGQIYFDVKDATPAYVERTLSVPVTNGQMTIGFWSDATATNQWFIADEISVERQP